MARSDRDIKLVFDRFIGGDDTIGVLHDVLLERAAEWCKALRVYEGPRNQRPVENGLREAVLAAAGDRGELYQQLIDRYGPGPGGERFFGTAELRGEGAALTVVVRIDEDPFARTGGALKMNDGIAVQVRRARVEGQPADDWAVETFRELCVRTRPAWGAVYTTGEYDRKVMSDGPETRALGYDFSRYLPGLFGVNFFGPRYVELIGRERLLGAPCARADELQQGIIVVLDDGSEAEKRWLDHVGERFFFVKGKDARETVAPEWT